MRRLDPRPSIESARIPCWMHARVFAPPDGRYRIEVYGKNINQPLLLDNVFIRMTRWCATLACRNMGITFSARFFNGDATRYASLWRTAAGGRSMTESSYDHRVSIAQEYSGARMPDGPTLSI